MIEVVGPRFLTEYDFYDAEKAEWWDQMTCPHREHTPEFAGPVDANGYGAVVAVCDRCGMTLGEVGKDSVL